MLFLKRSERCSLRGARSGDSVNLELSLRFGDRLGGSLVYGHVDATTPISASSLKARGSACSYAFRRV